MKWNWVLRLRSAVWVVVNGVNRSRCLRRWCEPWLTAWGTWDRLSFQYGHLESYVRWASQDRQHQPWPWITYPAIEFLDRMDLRDWIVFEYGCGNSTLFWSARAREVVSVEHDAAWYEKMRPQIPANCRLLFESNFDRYVESIRAQNVEFDLIVIDGRERPAAAKVALTCLRQGGMILLDNADWYPATSAMLRAAGLQEIDFYGFSPINDYTSVTSLFLTSTCRLRPRTEPHPSPGVGSLRQTGE